MNYSSRLGFSFWYENVENQLPSINDIWRKSADFYPFSSAVERAIFQQVEVVNKFEHVWNWLNMNETIFLML